MSDALSPSTTDPNNHAARAQAALWRQVELLETLAETGVQLAQAIAGRVDEAPAERAGEVAMAFSRAARAVRMTALLQSRLIKALDEARVRAAFLSTDQQEEAAEQEARQDPAYGHKARVEAIVARVARGQSDDEARIERIVDETGERLDDEDIYGDVLTRPVGELVSLICRDLGLSPDWERLGQEAWAVAEIAQDVPTSPFKNLNLPRPPSITAVMGGGGPLAERSEERVVVGAGQTHPHLSRHSESGRLSPAPSTIGSSANGPPPPQAGEIAQGLIHEHPGHHP